MSVAEIKSELAKLSAAQFAEIEVALQQLKDIPANAGRPLSESFGCARGTITFLPGWMSRNRQPSASGGSKR